MRAARRGQSSRIGLAAGLAVTVVGCAHAPLAESPAEPMRPAMCSAPVGLVQATAYRVQTGDTIWRIAQAFGVETPELALANHLRSPSDLKAGQVLLVPMPRESERFLWPARGQLTRARRPSSISIPLGVEIHAAQGSMVRASRTGRVAVAAHELTNLGSAIILDHGDGYATVYCGLDQLLVAPGAEVRQGAPVGRIGNLPLYFEIRYQARPHDPLAMLP